MNERRQLIILGQGPAGLSAAIYTARAGIDTLVIGCDPKIAGDYDIDNYFGFAKTVSGKYLIKQGCAQAERFGASLNCDRILSIHFGDDNSFKLKGEQNEYECCALIFATGVSRVRPGISNLADYEGKGVSYCVSCDGFFYRDKKVIVLGERNFAANQAIELTQYTPHVSICSQGKKLEMSDSYLDQLKEHDINATEDKIATLKGENGLDAVVYEDGREEDAHGLFIAMGEASSMDFAYSLGLERNGAFIQADYEQKTNIPGVFAAGDCVGRFLQISVAVGEGAKAGRSAIEYVRKNCTK